MGQTLTLGELHSTKISSKCVLNDKIQYFYIFNATTAVFSCDVSLDNARCAHLFMVSHHNTWFRNTGTGDFQWHCSAAASLWLKCPCLCLFALCYLTLHDGFGDFFGDSSTPDRFCCFLQQTTAKKHHPTDTRKFMFLTGEHFGLCETRYNSSTGSSRMQVARSQQTGAAIDCTSSHPSKSTFSDD